jgi:hypothetical protein
LCETSENIYHCITRSENLIEIYETPYALIDVDRLRVLKSTVAGISFTDGINKYLFNYSKSTLYKEFVNLPEHSFDVDIQEDPFELLLSLNQLILVPRNEQATVVEEETIDYGATLIADTVILPLYSPLLKLRGEEPVPRHSQLNQWNAGGRKRSLGEDYISIPSAVHKTSPGFFPPQDQPFDLHLPSGEVLKRKVCQANNKALMTNPNEALAEWLLRTKLELQEGELLTYNRLERLGIDSVIIEKHSDGQYSINFTKIGSYEKFIDGVSFEHDEENE